MFKSITGKSLWVNVLVAIVLVALLIFGFLSSLNYFTKHDKVLKIPSVAGKSLDDASKLLEKEGFDVLIQDSVYIDTLPPLTVIKQFPDADELVKVNRTVYLTVNRSVAPMVEMPNLVGMSIRNAELVLKQYGLDLGDTTFKPDFAKNSVLKQMVNGAEIKPGDKIAMGSSIDLLLGSGLADIEMVVPDLFGMTFSEAKLMIDSTGLSFGAKVLDPGVTDTANAYIYKQSPEKWNEYNKYNHIRPGQMIDIWLGTQKPVRDTTTIKTQTGNNY